VHFLVRWLQHENSKDKEVGGRWRRPGSIDPLSSSLFLLLEANTPHLFKTNLHQIIPQSTNQKTKNLIQDAYRRSPPRTAADGSYSTRCHYHPATCEYHSMPTTVSLNIEAKTDLLVSPPNLNLRWDCGVVLLRSVTAVAAGKSASAASLETLRREE